MDAFISQMPTPPMIVAVRPGAALDARPRLFEALASGFGVAFRAWAPGAPVAAVIEVAEGAAPAALTDLAHHALPSLAIAGALAPSGAAEPVELTGGDAVDRRVRGLEVADELVALPPADPAAEVLATVAAGAAWIGSRDPARRYSVGAALPELADGESLYSMLLRRPLAVIALVQFLRGVTARAGWQAPAVRASIVFDDPNLRWRSYGFIDYRRLAEHADAHDYHAAMAMIPLDAGRAHAPTVSLFARRPDRLSIVVHGNDHVRRELMGPRDRAAALAMTAQALRRVTRFERRSGLAVDRVMMPPHGLCSRHVAAALAALGFDGLCAIHPLPWTEERPAALPLLGWQLAEFVDGCAVVPRIHLSSSPAEIALRAFADQPLVLYGHHDDVADGLDALAEAAAAVNRLGGVRWMSVGEIARSNVLQRVTGSIATVRPFARRVRVDLAPGVDALAVDAPADAVDAGALVGWSLEDGEARPFGRPLRVAAGRPLDVRLHGRDDVDPAGVAGPAWRAWPRLRRAVTEVRDRVQPLAPARAR